MRKLNGSWIDKYLSWVTAASESPVDYHWWSAATTIAASLKRHVWFDKGTYKLYPNLFTVLVGRPGLGKGAAVNPAMSILKEANTTAILSDRVTIEYVLEKLSKGFPATGLAAGGGIAFGTDASIILFSPELSIFITASQYTLPILADLWDSREGEFSYGTRHKGDWKIKNSCVSLLAGSTQEWLISSIPNSAIGGGFTRRVNFVYGKDKAQNIPWPIMNHSGLRDNLVNDLRHISQLHGEFKYSPDAGAIYELYYNSALPDEFADEATTAYTTSAAHHATKLAMTISVAKRDTLIIEKEDIEDAIDKVEGVKKTINMVFRAVGESDLVNAADRVLRFIENKGLASRSDILRSNWRHISSNDLDTILTTFTQGGLLLERQQGNKILYEAVIQTKPKGGP
jgi:hypothetical protein